MTPKVSFQHTLREIAVNRDNPCEVVRELVSNAYDAGASEMWIIPLPKFEGLVFWDNGIGLSAPGADGESGYQAFFSIGTGTKTFGDKIGYKCQGSKLALAVGSLTLITRCFAESEWRWKRLENPKDTLDGDTDITPTDSTAPWKDVIQRHYDSRSDQMTKAALGCLDESFFKERFQSGTLLIMERIEGAGFEKHFLPTNRAKLESGYLYQYLRHYTAHGDVRLISKAQGFQPAQVKTVKPAAHKPVRLVLWNEGTAHEVPPGWPYLPVESVAEPKPLSPKNVQALKNGSFQARFAGSFSHNQNHYTVVLAIDGKRRTLSEYPELGRQKSSKSGLALSLQRGVIVAAKGVRVAQMPLLLEAPSLKEHHRALSDGQDHFALIIDGPFPLVTNRNNLDPEATALIKSDEFMGKVGALLEQWRKTQNEDGRVLAELEDALMGQASQEDRNQYIEARDKLISSLAQREQFTVTDVPALKDKWFHEPISGEENFVGLLYALLGIHVLAEHPLAKWWRRPITFNSRGIDSLANGGGSYIDLEYKWRFSFKDVYNHAFIVTDMIVCWDFDDPDIGITVRDDLSDQATVTSLLDHQGGVFGIEFADVRDAMDANPKQTPVHLISLKRLLAATFKLRHRKPAS